MDIKKLKEFVTTHWVPVVITGVLTIIGSVIVANLNSDISNNRFFLEKQAATADRMTLAFSKYVENLRRINEFKNYVSTLRGGPQETHIAELKQYVKNRTSARDELFSALDAVSLYFNSKVSEAVYEFRTWDEEQANKTTKELPSISEWHKRQRKILFLMREDIVK